MKKILDDLYTWSVFNEEKKLNFNGWYLRTAQTFLLIDPPPLSPEDILFVEKMGKPKGIFLTNKHHTRSSLDYRQRWGARISVHEKDQPIMEIMVDDTFSDNALLEGELLVIRIPDAKTPGECAFFWEKNKTLIIGDAMIGKPEGSLSLLPDEKFKDPKKARAGLRILRQYPFDKLLVGDGAVILQNAKAIFETFLKEQGV
jgi:glyoxylase-like metal-dependent hydrolase (beta-lactamase superfamily II)